MRPLSGYPTSWGNRRASVFPHAGPASYTRVSYGPLAGGDSVEAVEAGFKYFDNVIGGVTDSGNFEVKAIPPNESDNLSGAPSTTYGLAWFALRTASIGGQSQTAGTQAATATDLSGELVRLQAVGPN